MLKANDSSTERLAIDLAVQEIGPFNGQVLRQGARDAEFRIPVVMADGNVLDFRLSVRAFGDQLKVQESAALHLPSCCPNRHINKAGSFCITWASQLPIKVSDAERAKDWWDTVYRFLQEQHRAKKKRRWPTKGDWAHGDAAREQLRAEMAAAALGGTFAEDLRNGRLKVAKKGHFYRLVRAGRRVYSVWITHQRVATLRQLCFCPLGSEQRAVLRGCGDHAKAATDLVLGIVGRENEERRFWKVLKGQPCCGTMDDCPLAKAPT